MCATEREENVSYLWLQYQHYFVAKMPRDEVNFGVMMAHGRKFIFIYIYIYAIVNFYQQKQTVKSIWEWALKLS